ncbi:MAG: aldo/keto reductase [Rhodoferax sp.]|jgi:aryl-alcohol dehydrogenase-like predicted oxidoreductase|nr:aldo/keto reductase [Rhodoferax sp.]
MQYTNLGGSGLIVSRLSFGAMTLGEGILAGELKTHIGVATAREMLAMARHAGINLIDTADMYTSGQSEQIVGEAIKTERNRWVLSTKAGFRRGESPTERGLSYHALMQAADASLQRLQTDVIDVYLLHIPDPWTPLEETARAIEDLTRVGKIRYAGYCNYPAWKAQKLLSTQRQAGYKPIITSQMYYSLLGRDVENDHQAFLQDSGLGLMVWSPLASGFLSGKYTKETPVPADSRRAKFDFPPVDVALGYRIVDVLKAIAAQHTASVAQVSIAWLLARPWVSTVIVGANNLSQLEDNLGAISISLTSADLACLDEVSMRPTPYPQWMQGMGADTQIKLS